MRLSELIASIRALRKHKQFQKARAMQKKFSRRSVLATRNLAKDIVH